MNKQTKKLRDKFAYILLNSITPDYKIKPDLALWEIRDQLVRVCKEGGLKFVPHNWNIDLPHTDNSVDTVRQMLSQIKEIE